MAGRTFSAISRGTLTRTVSPLWLVSMTRTWSQRSEVLEDEEFTVTSWAREAGARTASGAKARAAARTIEAGRVVRCERILMQFSPSDGWRRDSPFQKAGAECPRLERGTDGRG